MITCQACKWWAPNKGGQAGKSGEAWCYRNDLVPMDDKVRQASAAVTSGPEFSCRHAQAMPEIHTTAQQLGLI